MEEIVDEQINRNLRNNIVVKDKPELEDEKWSNTKDIVATSFSNILNISKQTVYDGIERAHRGGKKVDTVREIFTCGSTPRRT